MSKDHTYSNGTNGVSRDRDAFLASKNRFKKELIIAPTTHDLHNVREEAFVFARDPATPLRDSIDVFHMLAQHFSQFGNYDEALRVARESVQKSLKDPKLQVYSEYTLASVYRQHQRNKDAMEILETMIHGNVNDGDQVIRAKIWTMTAGVYDSLGFSDKADVAYKVALDLREKIGDQPGLAVVYYNYAELCARRDDDAQALEFFTRAYNIEKEIGSYADIAQSACQIGILHAKRKKRETAQEFIDEAMQSARTASVPVIMAYVLANKASVHEFLGDEAKHEQSLLEARDYLRTHKFDSILGPVIGNLGFLYLRQRKIAEAKPLLEQAYQLSKLEDNKYRMGYWLLGLGTLERASGNFDVAINHLQKSIAYLREARAHICTMQSFKELALTYADAGKGEDSIRMLASWADEYVLEHDEAMSNRLRNVQRILEKERKEREEEIYRLKNVELSTAIKATETANAELQELAAEKDEFMAIAAHDLRNPLADMRGMLLTVLNHYSDLGKEDCLAICKDLLTTTTRMSATVHSFLEVSRTDRRASESVVGTIDLVHMAHRAMERFESRADQKKIVINVVSEGHVWGSADASIVDAVMDNLISNAIKYSPKNSEIQLDVSTDNEFSYFRVIDSGPGIKLEERSKLFTKYAKLSNRPTAGEDSLGLGLYLAKRMAERTNGTIYLEEYPNCGSCFTLRISAKPTEVLETANPG